MKIKNWQIDFENYWNSRYIKSFYLGFFTWSSSWAEYYFCFCNLSVSFYNKKKDDKYWEETNLTNKETEVLARWIGDK